MQTFLPLPNFGNSAKCLDDSRLKKQVVEGFQILNILAGFRTGFRHHPAVLMWKNNRYALTVYCMFCLDEYELNRNNSPMVVRTLVWPNCPSSMRLAFAAHQRIALDEPGRVCSPPDWFGGEAFHSAHRSILLAKDFGHYKQFGWKESPAVKNEKGQFPYVWPSKSANSKK